MRIRLLATSLTVAVLATGLVTPAAQATPLPNYRAVPVQAASVATGPSAWKGRRPLVHPNPSMYFYSDVKRWANLTLSVMVEQQIPRGYLAGILAQMQQESAGQPDVVNNWDSNAKRGTPSKGLMQIIAPTYLANAKPGYKSLTYQTVPYTNIWAALHYCVGRYGYKRFRLWSKGINVGY